jgi:hypothetical protein
MTELVLRLLFTAVVVATPVWLASHAAVLIRRRKPVLYFELQQLGRQGERLALVAFWAWNVAIIAALSLFSIAAVRLFN